MLPSTGYFKEVNCPFYSSGLCERPYCHFRHVRKDSHDSSTEHFTNDDVILQQLISEAVKKVLLHADSGTSETILPSQCQPKQDVSEVKPLEILPPPARATYNPTPIAELNKLKGAEGDSTAIVPINTDISIDVPAPKRHIPVPYTPHRPSKIQVKRSGLEDNEKLTLIDVSNLNKPYTPVQTGTSSGLTYSPNSVKDNNPDPYKPQGQSNVNGTYLPGSCLSKPQVYTPVGPTAKNNSSYVPTNISALQNQTIVTNAYEPPGQTISGVSYEPGGAFVSNHAYSPFNNILKNEPSLHYEPTLLSKPKYPCFSSDEDEPIPKKNKNYDITENGLEDFEVEFDIIGQILEEENVVTIPKNTPEKASRKNTKKDHSSTNKIHKNSRKSSNELRSESKRTEKCERNIDNKQRSHKEISHKESSRESSSSKSDIKGDDGGKSKNKSSRSKHSHSSSKSKHRDKSKDKESDKKHRSKTSEQSSRSSSKHSHSKKSSSENKSKQVTNTSQKTKNSSTHTSQSKSKHSNSKPTHKEKQRLSKEEDNQKDLSDDDLIKTDDDFSFDEDILTALSDSEPEDVTEQCLKIFEEYTPTLRQHNDEILEPQKDNDKVELYVGKKRVSHVAVPVKVTKTLAKPDFKVTAAQALADRYAKVKEYHISKRDIEAKELDNDFQYPTPIPISSHHEPVKGAVSKVRIAHVPNVSTMLTAKRTVTNAHSSSVNYSEPSTSTSVHTIAKGTTRTAHIPNEKFIDRPGVLEPLGSKIAANIRSRFLHLMIDECLKIYLAPEDAYARAQIEELTTSKKCTTIAIYRNSAIMAISRLRKELQDAGGVKRGPEEGNKVSHGKVLIGKLDQVSWSIESKAKKLQDFSDEFRGIKFYNNVAKWILTEQELQDNGFPRPHPSFEKGRAKIYITNTKQKPPKGNLRTCNRCKKDYTVDKKGKAIRKEECIYHPNNKYKFRGEAKYQCCSQDGSSEGCASAPCHVFEYVDYENLRGFVRTLPKDDEEENVDHGVYALDCEMCYTTQGLDLTRVTVIDPKCNVRYETLVRPQYPIIDYNTRYSGITEDQMQNVTTTLLQVQANLLHMFSDKTILVGHSLESDFKALKLIHNTVIDTSVLYPHKMGPPYKRALRNLTSEYLKKIIQNSVDGHDSNEDATVCMELIQFKLKEELKLR